MVIYRQTLYRLTIKGAIDWHMNITKYLPLTESTAYILLSLRQPMHGYGLMQTVETMSEGTVKIGPGTLYGAFSTIEGEGLIRMAGQEGRRKVYELTEKGESVLDEHIRRMKIFINNGSASAKGGNEE